MQCQQNARIASLEAEVRDMKRLLGGSNTVTQVPDSYPIFKSLDQYEDQENHPKNLVSVISLECMDMYIECQEKTFVFKIEETFINFNLSIIW